MRKLVLVALLFVILAACKKKSNDTNTQLPYPMGDPHRQSFAITDSMVFFTKDSSGVTITDTLYRYKLTPQRFFTLDIYGPNAYTAYLYGVPDTLYGADSSFTRSNYHGMLRETVSITKDSVSFQQVVDTFANGTRGIIRKGFRIYMVY